LAAVPSVGRAASVDRPAARGADAASDLYERYSTQIFGYCLHQLGSREEAEDAVQTTFMNAFRGLQRGIVPELESAWLFKIAHNVCLSRRRSTWRRGRVEAPNNLEVLQEVVPARERMGDELIRLQDVLEEMPENQRRAILLREWQGLTYREISDELELSQSAVETLIFRARRALAAGLEHTPSAGDRGRKRARHGADAGAVAIALKALVTGGAGAKIAVTALIVAATTIASPIGNHAARHVQHASFATATSTESSAPTRRAALQAPTRKIAMTATPTRHHTTPAPAPAKPKPTARSRQTPPPEAPTSTASAPAPAPQPAPAEDSKPLAYHAARAREEPGKSGDAPGQEHHASPPAATPAEPPTQPSDEHGNANAPGQLDKPDHGNGHK
jgi:RNA polymerase sigma factor (sigma-70 family)